MLCLFFFWGGGNCLECFDLFFSQFSISMLRLPGAFCLPLLCFGGRCFFFLGVFLWCFFALVLLFFYSLALVFLGSFVFLVLSFSLSLFVWVLFFFFWGGGGVGFFGNLVFFVISLVLFGVFVCFL